MKKSMIMDHKYITFPVCRHNETTKVFFYHGGTLVYDLDVKLPLPDQIPDFTAYVEMTPFLAMTLSVECERDCSVGYADALPADTAAVAAARPALHFTTRNGWNNDPNGLVLFDGVYHMYYQYNPCAPFWGNMHWKHAVSRDLLRWEEKDTVLYPDKLGTMYSGSAYVDRRNVSGLGTLEKPAILFFYTAAGGGNALSDGQPATQQLAYSTDGGETLIKYPEALIGHIVGYNRDPKVVFVPEVGRYVMVLYLNDNDNAIFMSDDLLHWEHTQTVVIPWDSECPNLVAVPLEGEARHLWVIFGAHGVYYVGEFKDGQFCPLQDTMRPHFENGGYAGQCFEGLDNKQAIRIDWLQSFAEGLPFSQGMTIPCVMTLRHEGDSYLLCHNPIPAVDALPGTMREFDHVDLSAPLAVSLTQATDGKVFDVDFTLPAGLSAPVRLSMYGRTVVFDPVSNRITCGKLSCPLTVDSQAAHIRVLIDTLVTEVFSRDGQFYIASHAADTNLSDRTLTLSADAAVVLNRVSVKSVQT